MKVVGIISEYNPFHFGHKYHLEKSLLITKATHSLAIMSGSFVQRGEPSLVDKWTKAKMAIDNGIDLVIELPFIFSCQSAEYFAYGAVNLMDSLNIVDYLAFGSEEGEIEPLQKISEILVNEPAPYKERLKHYLSMGLSFSSSRSNALNDYIDKENTKIKYSFNQILKQSNNILGIEYLKALIKLNSKILPVTIKRQGKDYNDKTTDSEFASATGIRNKILRKGLDSINNLVPHETKFWLEEYLRKYGNFNTLENYNLIFQYLLSTLDREQISSILDIEDGLENRIMAKNLILSDINSLVDSIATKRYPKTRIQRILIHILNNLYGSDVKELYDSKVPYIRVLGANKKGLELLNTIKSSSSIPIITKFADYKKYNNETINKFAYFEQKATDIFFIGISPKKPLLKMDYLISPYIK